MKMGVVIESDVWEPSYISFLFLFFSSLSSIFLLPYFAAASSKTTPLFSFGSVLPGPAALAPFLRFQIRFLLVYALRSVIEGLESVFGEFEYGYYGVSREWMVVALSLGCATSLVFGPFLGIFSDVIGHKKACLIFFVLHIFVGLLKCVTKQPCIWITSICLALGSSISSFSFETWMVVEHEKLGHRKELLSETFWLMMFSECSSLIGSQALANSLVRWGDGKGIVLPYAAAALLAMICVTYVSREWNGSFPTLGFWGYKMAFSAHILSDKRIWALAWAQACLHFSIALFWILWAPTTVADGREVNLTMIYPCLLGARMLGSTLVPWFVGGPLSVATEDYLMASFSLAGLALSMVAYDYQEISVLVVLFCFFHACVGLISPSLARLRTMFVPIELRAGMISLSLASANAAALFVWTQGGYFQSFGNSMMWALSALGLLTAAGCMRILRHLTKQPLEGSHSF